MGTKCATQVTLPVAGLGTTNHNTYSTARKGVEGGVGGTEGDYWSFGVLEFWR